MNIPATPETHGRRPQKWWSWRRITDYRQYSRGDRIVSNLAVGWTFYGLAVFGVIAVWNLGFQRWPVEWWFNLWRYYTVPLALLVGVVTAVWFTWGGSRDLIRMFRALRKLKRSPDDSGWVDESGKDRE